jgi:cytochrome c
MRGILRLTALAFAAAAAAGSAAARAPGLQLAESKQCLQCHSAGRDTIGPSFGTIRAIYRGVQDPETRMVAVIREGSSAHLGPLRGHARMPDGSERPAVSEAEARVLTRWILQGAKATP